METLVNEVAPVILTLTVVTGFVVLVAFGTRGKGEPKPTLLNIIGWALLTFILLVATFYTGYEYAREKVREYLKEVKPLLDELSRYRSR
ncbi:MAG: hypothetical protein LBG19_10050 [Prevotellaceae bacterium]|jgi:energy-coupling factor transporter transmembrane protein EcfT|nr:hypothetical protein [Prevotellaceae bacterium]